MKHNCENAFDLGTTGGSVSVSDSQQLSHEQMDREAQIQVDYRTLPISLREVCHHEIFVSFVRVIKIIR